MRIGELNKTVILIDSDFLNERILSTMHFYKELYPDKEFEVINLFELIDSFSHNARLEDSENDLDVLFAYRLSNDNLENCRPRNLTVDISSNGVRIKSELRNFVIRSFFADENESCSRHFVNMLKIVHSKSNVSKIILIGDSPELNSELKLMLNASDRKFFLFKKSHESFIGLPIQYIDVDYLVAFALGLDSSEI